MRLALRQLSQLDHGQHISNAPPDFLGRALFHAQAIGHIAGNGHVREQGILLEYGIKGPTLRWNRGNVLTGQRQTAAVRALESRQQPQKRGFATARGTEQSEKLTIENIEVQRLQDGPATVVLADSPQGEKGLVHPPGL